MLTCLLVACGPQGNQKPLCCEHAPNKPRHVNKDLASGKSTPVNVANLSVVHKETYVDTSVVGIYTLHAAIMIDQNGGNNCADSVNSEAIITLPQYSIVKSIKAESASGRSLQFQQCKAQVRVKLSYLCPNDGKDKISIIVERAPQGSPADCQPSFSVYAYSGMPDNDPSNNYWWWRRTCGQGQEDYTPLDPTWGPQ